jgi:hypothetical protein
MAEKAFLTEKRKQVLNGVPPENIGSDGISDGTYRQHRAATKRQARAAVSELLQVAASPTIDNADVFEPEVVRALITTLLIGSGGAVGEDVPDELAAWDPDPEFAKTMYIAVNQALQNGPEL